MAFESSGGTMPLYGKAEFWKSASATFAEPALVNFGVLPGEDGAIVASGADTQPARQAMAIPANVDRNGFTRRLPHEDAHPLDTGLAWPGNDAAPC